MTIQDRLRNEIAMVSPEGDAYEGKWIGNPRRNRKKLGLFQFPKVKGTKGQDLEVGGDEYPLTIYFDGGDNDQVSDDFHQSLKQRGKWEIIHPLYGQLFLQLVDWEQQISPVENINYMVFTTNWIETLPDGSEISLAELLGLIDDQANLANESAAAQFKANAFTELFDQAKRIASAANRVVNSVKKNLRIFQNFNIIPAEVDAIIRGIKSTVDEFPIDTEVLASQIQNLVQIYVLGQDNVLGALDLFNTFATSLEDEKPSVATKEGVSQVAVQELALSATMVAIGQSVRLNGIETRTQAVESANAILEFFENITNTLDETQTLYEDVPIEFQYFSQSQSFTDNSLLAAQAAQYLLVSAIDLKIERRFKTTVPRSFLEICGTEYGNVDDETLDYYIKTNNLKNNEIRAPLPAETTVRVFI
jgi:hypothetical protein